MDIKIVDCTMRDGGLLNNWEFEDKCVKASYFAAFKAGVNYFEIGYKAPSSVKNRGKYGYCEDEFISSLMQYTDQCKLLFMVDTNKFEESIKIPTCQSDKTPFRGVRIATYPSDIKLALHQVEEFYDKGYEVFLNMMVFSEWGEEQFQQMKMWKNKNHLKALYFVDSFGHFVPQDISVHTRKLRELGFENIGFHGHNSLQMAFANSIKAIEEGATYIDATIYGMGRGSGNLPMEIFLSYMQVQKQTKYNAVPYLEVIERFYLKLFAEYGWGYSLKSLLGGIKNIHPYYIDELVKLNAYTSEEIWNALDCIKEKCPVSYSKEKLKWTMEERFYTPSPLQVKETIKEIEDQIKIFPTDDAFLIDKFALKDKYKGRRFLIIANGPSIKKYKDKIQKLIVDEKLITIGCNYLQDMFQPYYHIFVSKKRFLKYITSVNKNSVLIMPTFFGKRLVSENYNGKYEYIEIRSSDDVNSEPVKDDVQQSVYLNVANASILTAYQMGAKEIMVAGMDGYEPDEPNKMVFFYNENDVPDDKRTASIRYEKLAEELKRVNQFLSNNGVLFSIITPTSHKRYYKNMFC